MTENANPSLQLDPAVNETLAGTFQFILNKFKQWDIDDMLPVRVIAYNAEESPPSVQVQPLVMMVDTNDAQYSRAQIASIPVLQIGGGGFLIYFNIKPGDIGFMKANDRDLSIFFQSLNESKPGTNRSHSFSDAVFIPAVLSGYTIDPLDTGMVLQSLDGTVKISLNEDAITILAPNIDIETETLELTATTEINITSPIVTLTGNLNVIGNITATGTITPGV